MSFCKHQFPLEDIYDHDKSDLELMTLVESSEWCINKNFVTSFLTPSGQWRFSRHKNNKLRGDRSSIDAHKKNMQTVGMLQDLGGEPFLIQDQNPERNENFDLCHFASRAEGLHDAWVEDVNKENKAVQLSIQNGFKRAKLWSRRSPDWLTVFLVAVGNVGNSEVIVM